MPFDRFLFVGTLQLAGKLLRRNRVYTVSRYSSLEPLFSHQWHLRVLNKHFCYIIKETVHFYLHRRLDIEDQLSLPVAFIQFLADIL